MTPAANSSAMRSIWRRARPTGGRSDVTSSRSDFGACAPDAMKAARFSRFGGPEVLEIVDLPDPHPGPGQIRVAVHAAGVNPSDWKARKGELGGELPQTTGRDVAGVVDEIAKSLRNQNAVDVSRRGLFHFFKIVIGQGLLDGNFDSHRGLILVRSDSYGHERSSHIISWNAVGIKNFGC